jgi:uncharacterized membrane protein YvlD (DUF360 family)
MGAAAAALGVFVSSKVLSDVRVRSTGSLALVAVVFGILNAVLGSVLAVTLGVLLIPLGVLTLGLVYLLLGIVVNMALLWITDKLLDGFEIRSFRGIFWTAALVSLASSLVEHVF